MTSADWECVLSREDVDAGIRRLAARIQPFVDAQECILLAVMTGGMYPLVRLTEELRGDFLIDYCHATRYGDSLTGGRIEWLAEPTIDLAGRTVIVVDDIWDEGTTLAAVAARCGELGAAQVLTAVLFIKERDRAVDARPPELDAGLSVPDRYVFGCGMDMNYHWRHLPAVYALAEQSYEGESR